MRWVTKLRVPRRAWFALLSLALVSWQGWCAADVKVNGLARVRDEYHAGHMARARALGEQLLKAGGRPGRAHYWLGRIDLAQGKVGKAESEFKAAIAASPRLLGPRVSLARLYLGRNELDKSERAIDAALKLAPKDPEAHVVHAAILAQRGDISGSLREALVAWNAAPGDPDTALVLASLFLHKHQPEGAIDILHKALASHPKDIPLRVLLVRVDTATGKLRDAIESMVVLVKLQPADLARRIDLARLYVADKQPRQADKVLRKALAKHPKAVSLQLALADFLASQRGLEAGAKQLRAEIKDSPHVMPLRFGLAELYERGGHDGQALPVYRAIIERSGMDRYGLEARRRLAALLLRQGDLRGAWVTIGQVLKQRPDDWGALVVRGGVSLARNHPHAAVADYRSALRHFPKDVRLYGLLARAYLAARQPRLARQQLDSALKIRPNDLPTHVLLARVLERQGDTDAALAQYSAVLKLAPRDVPVVRAALALQLRKHDWKAAEQTVAVVGQAFPGQPIVDYLQGVVREARGDAAGAIAAFEAAAKEAPDAYEPLTALVRVYVAQGRVDRAIQRVNQTLGRDPHSAVAYTLLARLYTLQRNDAAAESALTKAVSARPRRPGPYRNLGGYYLAHGQVQRAIATYRRGVRAVPGNWPLTFLLAGAYQKAGMGKRAEDLYEQLLRRQPRLQVVANNLALLLAQRRDPADRARALQLVKPLRHSDNPIYEDTAGWVYLEVGKPARAVAVLRPLAQRYRSFGAVQYHLGMAYYRLKDRAQAKLYLQRAVATKQRFNGLDRARTLLKQL